MPSASVSCVTVACLVASRPVAILPVIQDPVVSLVLRCPVRRYIAWAFANGTGASSRPCDRILACVGLGEIDVTARPSELCASQCPRVALVSATIAAPVMIVADEPTSAFDSPATWLVSKLLRDAADQGSAVLVVSHDSPFLDRLADHVVTMQAGRTLPRAKGG